MKKDYIVWIVTIVSLFSMILLAESAFAVEKSQATSNVGIKFYGEYPAIQESTESPKTGDHSSNGGGKLPSTGEKKQTILPFGIAVLAAGVLMISTRRMKKSQENKK